MKVFDLMKKNNKVTNNLKKAILAIFICFAMAANVSYAEHELPAKGITYEYAIFYMETQGDFMSPVAVDAPAIYSWNAPDGSVKGEVQKIWQFLAIKKEVEYSIAEIELTVINHVAQSGWQLEDLEITSVPLPRFEPHFRTAYRYIFKRVKNARP